MLEQLLPAGLFAFLLVFVRIGAAVMLLPGIGEPFVAARIRLAVALMVAAVTTPLLIGRVPPMPASAIMLALLILGEAVIGLFLGTVARLFLTVFATAGVMIGYMTAMANALINDPSTEQQGSISGSFLTVVALLVIFSLNLHHAMLLGVVDSYEIFVPGQVPPIGDFSEMVSQVVAKTFLLAFQIASPFIAVGLISYLGLGVLGRLMPQMQVFFVAIPLQVMIGLAILFLSLPAMMRWFVTSFEETWLPFLPL